MAFILGQTELIRSTLFMYRDTSVAIYYGKDISAINKKILSNIAKEKGLKEYQMYIDVQSEQYTMKYRKL